MSLGLADAPFREKTTPLLRPDQAIQLQGDIKRTQGMLSAPPYIANAIENKGELRKQLQRMTASYESQAPTPYETGTLDAAKARHDELLAKFMEGMPTQAEMRRRPAGAVDKHAAWEKRNKPAILEFKNIRRRLHAGGMISDDAEATEIANIEQFRPSGGAQELNMHDDLITPKTFFMSGATTQAAVMSDAVEALLAEVDPDVLARMGLLNNDQRAEVIGLAERLLDGAAPKADPKPAPKVKKAAKKKARKAWSPAAKKAASDRMKAMNAARARGAALRQPAVEE